MTRGTHLFVHDATVPPDRNGHRFCLECKAPEQNGRHLLPPMTDDQHAAEQRRIGERGDTP